MRKVYMLFFALFIALTGFTQSEQCGTPDSNDPNFDRHDFESFVAQRAESRRAVPDTLPLKIHLIRRSNGTGGMSLTLLYQEIASINNYYANSDMYFVLCDGINFINSDRWYDFDSGSEQDLYQAHVMKDVINVYIASSVRTGSGSAACGFATFPWSSSDRIVLDKDCASNGSTFAHELGHYFGVAHTHSGGDELADGSNCANAGDYICDTPADPRLGGGNVNGSCNYVGNEIDANGDGYDPNPRNIMSYAPKPCRDYFSQGQYDVISYYRDNGREYLRCGINLYKRASVFTSDGSVVNAVVQISNDGNLAAEDPFYIEIFARAESDSGNLVSDIVIVRDTIEGLDPDVIFQRIYNVDVLELDPCFPLGDYYLGLRIDGEDIVDELDEQDNESLSTSPVLELKVSECFPADLTVLQNVDTVHSVASLPLNAGFDILNAGPGWADDSEWTIYFSEDAMATTSDPLLYETPLAAQEAGDTVRVQPDVLVPDTLEGTYSLLVCANVDEIIGEMDFDNNCRQYIWIVEQPIVHLEWTQSLDADQPLHPFDSISIRGLMANAGNVPAGTVDFELSLVSDNGERYLWNAFSRTDTVQIVTFDEAYEWPNLPLGGYALEYCALYGGPYSQNMVDTFCSVHAFEINNDLKLDVSGYTPGLYSQADTLKYNVEIVNLGNYRTYNQTEITTYLEVPAMGFEVLAVDPIDMIDAGDTLRQSFSHVLENVDEGEYDLIICADGTDFLDETNEDNNCVNSTIEIESVTGINTVLLSYVEVFPNPVHDVLHIRLADEGFSSARLIALDGKLMDTKDLRQQHTIQWSFADMPNGVYVLRLMHSEGTASMRVVKQ